MELESREYYVYFLINPITETIFYVGKGKGKRKDHHLRSHKNGKFDNPLKHKQISDILKAGETPIARIYQDNLTEPEAYAIERSMIQSLPNLTNISEGQISEFERSKIEASLMLDKVIPFEEWKLQRNPTTKDIECYFLIVKGLQEISVSGSRATYKFVSHGTR